MTALNLPAYLLGRALGTILHPIITPILRKVTMPCAGWNDEDAGEWCMEWSWPGDEQGESA